VKPQLVLVPNFIGDFNKVLLPKHSLDTIYSLHVFIVEREKTARAFLKAIEHPTPQNDFIFCELDKHNNYDGFKAFFRNHIEHNSIGLLSEAGLPAIADPGSEVVKYAHDHGVQVRPLSGSSSIFLGLMASGMNGQDFAFNGYLPIDQRERVKKLKELEVRARKSAQVFMETPYRNNQFLDFLIKNLQNDTRLAIAADMETSQETIISKPVKMWNKTDVDLHKRPCIFIIGT
jgi:16S rRNA (cytidine1402-2'-O)-methyltransferase